ncbi:hypothetical protein RND81_04G146200 [Saponaria officinalis]|uniref:XS domain-containing protein n=1 Tax=Saponaria officinalis TaxID=3572 RepID=A0AAW1LE99_SAPOF
MIERREMAEIYSRNEIGLHNEGINRRLCEERRSNDDYYVMRGNADGFRTLSQSHDHDFSIRDSTASRFQWNSLLNESNGGSSFNGVREDSEHSMFVTRERNYDERTRNMPTYDHNVGGLEYYRRSRNVTGLPTEDGRIYTVRESDYPPRTERELVRQHYVDEHGRRFCHEGGSHSSTPISQSSDQPTPFRGIDEGLPREIQYRSVDGLGSVGRIPSSRSSSYRRIPYINVGRSSDCFSAEGVSPRGEYTLNVCRVDDYIYLESQRAVNLSRITVSKDDYDDDHNVPDYNDQGGTFGTDVVNATLPRHHNAGYSRRDVVLKDEYSPSQNISHPLQKTPNSRISYEMVYGVGEVNFGLRNSYHDDGIADIHGTPPRDGQFSYERKAGGVIYEGDYVNNPRQIERVSVMDRNTGQMLETRDFTLPEKSNTMRKRRHEFVDQLSDAKRRTICITGASSYGNGLLSANDEEEFGFFDKFRHQDELHSRDHTGMFDEPQESVRGDVKKRLKFPHAVSRPCAPQLPWKQEARSKTKHSPDVTHIAAIKTYGKAKGTDFKKKLKSVPKPGFCPSVAPDYAVQSSLNKKQQQKLPSKNSGSSNDPLCSLNVDPDQSVFKVKLLEDLPEDSKKFKQLVDEWFLKCMEHLNGNTDCQKRLNGKEIGGKLKCIICSSHKEFIETKDVAAHAFASTKVGYRAQHLGFHRALCVLMGWDRAVAPNGRWVCKSLPELEAWTLREDVIIWPPVVIIHNNLARNHQLNDLGNVSVKLENILRDKGFTSEIKGCYENPGNPNIMVVKFKGTLPGLKEAERLHNYFAENKLGRAELAQIDPEVCNVVDKKPENEQTLVDGREHDRGEVDKAKDEQPKFKIGDFGMLIDKSDDDDESLDKTQIDHPPDKMGNDQEPADMARDDRRLVDKAHDDQEPVDKAHDNQEPLENAQDDRKPLNKAQGAYKPLDKARDDQKLLDKAGDDKKLLDEARDDQNLLDKARGDKKVLDEVRDDPGPLDKAQDDQWSVDKIDNDQELMNETKDDQALKTKAADDEELMKKTKDDQALKTEAEDDQALKTEAEDDLAPLVKAGDYDLVPTNKAEDDQEPLDKDECAQGPVGKTENDHKPVGKTEETLYGYLGIIEDLSKLHNDLKRHHLARSKKEILASFNALM